LELGQLEATVGERAQRLRDRAEQLRVVAGSMKSKDARLILFCLAEDYEKLSQHAERHALGIAAERLRVAG
jgi:hypothetical protein